MDSIASAKDFTNYNLVSNDGDFDYSQYLDYLSAEQDKRDQWSAEQAQKQMDWQKEMSDTAHQREVEDLKKAGLNPVLSAGGQGATTGSGAMAQSSGQSVGAMMGILSKVLDAQLAALESPGTGKKVETHGTGHGTGKDIDTGSEEEPYDKEKVHDLGTLLIEYFGLPKKFADQLMEILQKDYDGTGSSIDKAREAFEKFVHTEPIATAERKTEEFWKGVWAFISKTLPDMWSGKYFEKYYSYPRGTGGSDKKERREMLNRMMR